MLLEHRFVVPLQPDDAWAMLLDVERVAPCLPGVTLESVEGLRSRASSGSRSVPSR